MKAWRKGTYSKPIAQLQEDTWKGCIKGAAKASDRTMISTEVSKYLRSITKAGSLLPTIAHKVTRKALGKSQNPRWDLKCMIISNPPALKKMLVVMW